MSDCMHFPDTVEEFMEQYKMTDAKQVYSNLMMTATSAFRNYATTTMRSIQERWNE